MADGLLTSGLNWIDEQKQALKARFGLLADNPEEFARQLAAEQRQRAGVGLLGEPKTAQEMASGAWINTPYGQQAMEAGSGFAGTTIGKNAIAAAKETLNKPRMGVWQGEKPLDMWKAEQQARMEAELRDKGKQNFLEPSKIKQRLYHGTTSDITQFDPSTAGKKTGNVTTHFGTFLSDSPKEANRYATEWGVEGGNVIPVHVQIKNPYPMSYAEFDHYAMGDFRRMMEEPGYDPTAKTGKWTLERQKEEANKTFKHRAAAIQDVLSRKQELINAGYDGIVVKIGGNNEYIAFEPTQVKSAIGNIGTYDITNPNILAAGVPLGLLAGTNVEMQKKQEKKSMTPKR